MRATTTPTPDHPDLVDNPPEGINGKETCDSAEIARGLVDGEPVELRLK